jgi:hypothetical protein
MSIQALLQAKPSGPAIARRKDDFAGRLRLTG